MFKDTSINIITSESKRHLGAVIRTVAYRKSLVGMGLDVTQIAALEFETSKSVTIKLSKEIKDQNISDSVFAQSDGASICHHFLSKERDLI